MAGIHMENKHGLTQVVYSQFAQQMDGNKLGTHEVCNVLLDTIKSAIPYFEGNYDPHAYIEWELAVDKEFVEYDLSEKQMVFAASNALTKDALYEWKYLCRHDIVPQTWKDFKMHFRGVYVPAYYADYLLTKLEELKQGSRTVRQYYHDFKICILFGGLDECMEDIMSRFMKGLNSEIQTLLISETYNHISCLFCLACKVENQILSSLNTCKNGMTHYSQQLSTLNVEREQNIVELVDDMPLSQHDLLVVPCDKEELCDTSSLTSSPRLEIEHPLFPLAVHNILQEDESNTIECIEPFEQLHPLQKLEKTFCATPTMSEESEKSNTYDAAITPCEYDHASLISTTRLVLGHDNSILNDMHAKVRRVCRIASEKEELNIISSLNCLGYIEFDFLCDLNSLENDISMKSVLPSFIQCSLYAIGKYDSKGNYLVHKVYICSNMKSTLELQYHDQIKGCTNTNNVQQSIPSFSYMQQGQPKEGKYCLLLTCNMVVLRFSDINITTFEYHWSKSRTTCSQERENDEDITDSYMSILSTSKPKVQPFYMRLIIDTFDEWVLHHKICVLSFSELHAWIKGRFDCIRKAWKINEVDWGPSPSVLNVLHKVTTSVLAKERKESKSNTFWKLNSDCRKVPTCYGHHDFIRTRIWMVQDLMESLTSLLSFGSSPMSVSSTQRRQLSKYYREILLSRVLRHHILGYWPMYQVGSIKDTS